tara:strand:- start:167 stop:598 length:432 start_codon:yes stop_codon:yes gene_type:complete
MSTHDVGTVLWIIHTDRPGLMAYQVTEEITKKTLEGEKIQYIVRAALPKSKEVRLETIKGNIFKDSEEAKHKMTENATRAIDGMVEKIQGQVDTFFFNQKSESAKLNSSSAKSPKLQKLKSGYQWVTMDDGSKVQVKLPETLS